MEVKIWISRALIVLADGWSDFQNTYSYMSSELLRLKDSVFINNGAVNPIILGEIIAILRVLGNEQGYKGDWNIIHPIIERTSRRLYDDGHYANAAEDAFIEINSRVKKLYKVIKPNSERIPDGIVVMHEMFSTNKPMISFANIATETGMNIQRGYMEMFAGAIAALRNPKAHENITITREECIKRLVFASMLMDILDEGVKYTGISEYN